MELEIARSYGVTGEAGATAGSKPVVHIAATPGWGALRLGELWAYRELLYFLVWRDVKVRYKQTALGATWAVLQPLLNSIIFAFLFGRVGKMPSDGYPHFIFTFAGMVPWQLFSFGLTQSSNSLVTSANLIKKIYFPRLAIPIATVLSGTIDFVIALSVLLVLMPFYGLDWSWSMLWLPWFALLTVVAALGTGLWFSAWNVKYRDVRYVVGFLTQFWMLATPVAWSTSHLPPSTRMLLGLNPMTGVVEGFRCAVLGAPCDQYALATIGISTLVSLLVLASGVVYFRRLEKSFADIV